MLLGACRAYVPLKGEHDIFFPEEGQSVETTNRARVVCFSCTVFKFCQEYQGHVKNTDGIWAARLANKPVAE
jgi:Transcription factor WhiB